MAPPPLPSYEQPPIPAAGFLWVPGFWAWRKSVPDYFWVPGTWVRPPRSGLLWTPPYWSRITDGYAFHDGYWAADVGFYGGIDYGFGYDGNGYQGGGWQHGRFVYNRAANNLGPLNVATTESRSTGEDGSTSHASYNGGRQGTTARPSRHEDDPADGRHVGATTEQQKHFELAAMDRSLYSKLNNGEPPVAATQHAGTFDGPNITESKRHPKETSPSGVDDSRSSPDIPATNSGREQPTAK